MLGLSGLRLYVGLAMILAIVMLGATCEAQQPLLNSVNGMFKSCGIILIRLIPIIFR